MDNPIYAYAYDSVSSVKFLSPFEEKKRKWYGNAGVDAIAGLKQLPESGELLIITKSHKDVMCLGKAGYSAISFQGETNKPDKKLLKKLEKRFKEIIILYDNDKDGIKAAKKLSKDTGYTTVFLVSAKDFSDLVKSVGYDTANNELGEILQQASD